MTIGTSEVGLGKSLLKILRVILISVWAIAQAVGFIVGLALWALIIIGPLVWAITANNPGGYVALAAYYTIGALIWFMGAVFGWD